MKRSLKSLKHWLWEIVDSQSVRRVFWILIVAASLMALNMAISESALAADVKFDAEIQASGQELILPQDSTEYSAPLSAPKVKAKKTSHGSQEVCLPSPDCQVDKSRTHTDSNGLDGSGNVGGPGYGVFVSLLNTWGGSASHSITEKADGRQCLSSSVTVHGENKLFGGGAWYEGRIVIYGKCPTPQPWQSQPVTVTGLSVPENPSPVSYISLPQGNYTGTLGSNNPNALDKLGDSDAKVAGEKFKKETVRYTVKISNKEPKLAPLLAGMFEANPNVSDGTNGPNLWAVSSSNNDIQAVALEITQGTQNLTNEMPLVEGRRTMVRAYIATTNLNVGVVNARLRAYRNGQELLSSPILAEPINSKKITNNGQKFGGERQNLLDSFLFKIPKDWRSGTVTFRVEINYDQLIPEIKDDNNTFEQTVVFQSSTVADITTVPFHLHEGGDRDKTVWTYDDTNSSFGTIIGNMYRFHPISQLRYWDCGVSTQVPRLHSLPYNSDWWPLNTEWNFGKDFHQYLLLVRLEEIKLWQSIWGGNCGGNPELHWVGMVHPKISGGPSGIALPFIGVSLVKMDDTPNKWYVEGGETLAHETGHNKGLFHVKCKGSEDGPYEKLYPYQSPDCRLDKDQYNDGFFGLDVYYDFLGNYLPTVISNDPNDKDVNGNSIVAYPFMGYQSPYWTSPYEYAKLLRRYGFKNSVFCNAFHAITNPFGISCDAVVGIGEGLSKLLRSGRGLRDGERPTEEEVLANPTAFADPQELQALQEANAYLVVNGMIAPSSNTFGFEGVYQVHNPSKEAIQEAANKLGYRNAFGLKTDVPFTLVQLDKSGTELSSQEIFLASTNESVEIYPFLELLPLAEGVTSIQIRRGTEVLAEKTASANPPTVKLLAPNQSGLLVAGTMIQWESADADGDELSFNLFYSPDDGQTWRLVEMGLTGNSYKLSTLANLPSSEHGRFRIMAHDGFYTTYDDSDVSFSVPNSPPRTIIFQPTGMKYQIGETVILNGIATDIDDGPITNESQFSWTSDLDGYLGIGQELFTRKLSQGIHHITLSVVDSKGAKGSATIEIIIEPALKTGIFTVDKTGIVKIDWLYDGGKYQGEFGIFNLAGMENLTPGSPEFIAEAVKRVLSNSDQGYLVFSDLSEGARFSGLLGGEVRDWNTGDYKGLKSFAMKPGSQIATMLVPNSTFASLAQNPATTDTNKRPLFSLVSSNPVYGMFIGQMADVNGMGKAYSYEDKDAATSDKDFNDLIVKITGATGNVPSIDELKDGKIARSRRDGTDWRTSELGMAILEHVVSPAATEDTISMTVTLNDPATLLVYDAAGNVIGKSGAAIAGADFELKTDGTQTVTLPNPTGNYRLSIQGTATAHGTLTVKTYQGGAEISSKQISLDIATHQILTTTIAVSDTVPPTVAPVNTAPSYDFNADGVVDNTDVEMLVRHWNSCKGQQKYDAFFDVNDDGCITVADIMTVLNAKTVK